MFPALAFLLVLTLGPFSASANFTVDLMGAADARPDTWGSTGVQTWDLTFTPPAGYRVHVLELHGDLVAWPKILPGDPPLAPGLVSGVLLGFQTSAPGASVRCDLCADNTMIYLQGGVGGGPAAPPLRLAYDRDVSANGLLQPDNVLKIVVASWLNATGKPIHIEPTFNVIYRFEKEIQR